MAATDPYDVEWKDVGGGVRLPVPIMVRGKNYIPERQPLPDEPREHVGWIPCHPVHGPIWDAITFQERKPTWTYRGQDRDGYVWRRCMVRIDDDGTTSPAR